MSKRKKPAKLELVEWKVHFPHLMKEILSNPQMSILNKPLQILSGIMREVGMRAAQLDDPIMNHLMCRLAIYAVADPEDANYFPDVVEEVKKKAIVAREEIKQEGLFDVNPDCKHVIVPLGGGGIKCKKCGGWFCY